MRRNLLRVCSRAGDRQQHARTAAVFCLTLLSLVLWGCSRAKGPETATTDSRSVAKQPAPGQSQPSVEEAFPPVVSVPWRGDLDEMARRRVVRVLLPFRRPEFFYIDGRPAGLLQEAFHELETVLNAKYKTTAASHIVVALVPTPIYKLRERMLGGYGDIAAYSLSITEKNQKLVDFTVPTMSGLKIVVVTGPGAPEIKTPEDLSGKEVWAIPQTRMRDDLEALNAKLRSQQKAPVVIREADSLLDPADVLEMVNAGIYPVTLIWDKQAEFWSQFFENVKPRMDLAVAEDVDLGWAIQKGTPKLKAFLDDFIKTHGVGTTFGNTLMRRYLKETRYVKNARDPAEMQKFRAMAPFFTRYAKDYEFDPLLVVAQGYQESGLNQSVKSKAGAIGIMQVMPSTAASEPVKIRNIYTADGNIHAGMRMLHFLVNDYFNEPGLDQLNRTLLAIAAYNAGPTAVARCRKLAKDMGYDPNKWFSNVEVATARVVGRETTQYVANIYKYYLAYRMAAQIVQDKAAAKAKRAAN